MTSRLNPCLLFDGNAREAMTFYQSVLGGDLEIGTAADFGAADPAETDDDKVMHSTLNTLDGYTLMAWDAPDRVAHRPGNNVAVFIGGTGEALTRHFVGLAESGTVTLPLDKQPWGDVAGSLVDQFGITWMFNIDADADVSDASHR
ncbi:MAG: VOC family protein [Propionibacteriales bacterium]|nr:VOC family protein [Propionibacteriales bacterium]